jgi:hypothetical protein
LSKLDCQPASKCLTSLHDLGEAIMNDRLAMNLLLALASLSFGAGAAGAADGIYACTHADGSVELTSTNAGPQCELMAASEAAESPARAPTASATAASGAPSGSAKDKPAEDPRKLYRDAMVDAARKTDGAASVPYNPALSRRYLMVNKADYAKSVTGTTTH